MLLRWDGVVVDAISMHRLTLMYCTYSLTHYHYCAICLYVCVNAARLVSCCVRFCSWLPGFCFHFFLAFSFSSFLPPSFPASCLPLYLHGSLSLSFFVTMCKLFWNLQVHVNWWKFLMILMCGGCII